jgi:Skp family chaperone for outer membrane proteins
MRGFTDAVALVLILGAAPAAGWAAQQTAGQAPSQAPARAPAAPAQPPPAQPPALATPAPAPLPPAPFPQGAKVAFVNLQAIASLSAEGKAAASKVNDLFQKKQTEAAAKAKLLQGNQQKLQTSGSVMSEAARAQLEKEIERQQVEGQRFEQDAQSEVNDLQQQLQQEFQKKLLPVLEELRKEKGLQALFSAGDSGVLVADQGLDLTLEAVKKLDAATAKPAK